MSTSRRWRVVQPNRERVGSCDRSVAVMGRAMIADSTPWGSKLGAGLVAPENRVSQKRHMVQQRIHSRRSPAMPCYTIQQPHVEFLAKSTELTLLTEALRKLGFEVTELSGRLDLRKRDPNGYFRSGS